MKGARTISLLLCLALFAASTLSMEGRDKASVKVSFKAATPGGKELCLRGKDILERFLPLGERSMEVLLREEGSGEPDSFSIATPRRGSYIISSTGKGLVYGACELLMEYLDMDYWGDGQYYIPDGEKTLPVIDSTFTPAFSYRQSQNYMLSDPLYKWWYRLEEPSEEFAGGLWVHTCNYLLPSDRYGRSHPEYYAFYDGRRHPGSASQWCLSNPEVLEIVCSRVDSIFRANPGRRMISISQNDGSDTFCRCPDCQRIIDEEGSPSGPMIRFVNKVAERFPDRTISTLAYVFTLQPPKLTVPRRNVNIMLCDIDCRRQTALTENPSGQVFMKALEGWSDITDNIFLWDYGINFDNYLSPFPNFSTIWYNMQIFRDHGVRMHFSQIGGQRGGDFSELRSYIVNRLMWSPDTPLRDLLERFLGRYYGPAGRPIYDYIRLMEGAAVGGDVDLFIYDSPVSYKDNILSPALLRRYNDLFDEAEQLVKDDPVLLARVRRSRLSLQYSSLEIARTDVDMDREKVARDLDLFEKRTEEFEVPTLNERHNSPKDYCSLYRSRYLTGVKDNLAFGARVSYRDLPERKYIPLAEKSLTDGLFGGTTFVENWVGWEGRDAAFTLDLGKVQDIESVSVDFLKQLGAWILLPRAVSFLMSTDGETFTLSERKEVAENRDVQVEFIPISTHLVKKTPARYIRIEVEGTNTCPSWHYGVGNPCWFFIDEVIVR